MTLLNARKQGDVPMEGNTNLGQEDLEILPA